MRASRGFTLVELMIVVVVVAILATVAYPAYLQQVRATRRADAQAALAELSQFMERTYTENNVYNPGGAAPALPAGPTARVADWYTITLSAVAAQSYTLRAVPTGTQTDDACGTMTLANTGATTAVRADCWRR